MIKVIFKRQKSQEYDEQEFTYAGYDNAEVGDIVAVETRYGYAIAKVAAVDIVDERFSEQGLAKVKAVIESKAEQKMVQLKKEMREALIKRMRRKQMLIELDKLGFDKDDKNIIDDMTDEELNSFYKEIMK